MVAPFAMVAGGTITALQIYKPQYIIAWGRYLSLRSQFPPARRGWSFVRSLLTVHMTVGAGIITLIKANSSAWLWVPLYVLAFTCNLFHCLTSRVVLVQADPVLNGYLASQYSNSIPHPCVASSVTQALAFIVFLRNFGQILGITIGVHLTFLICDRVSFMRAGSVVLMNEPAKKLPGTFWQRWEVFRVPIVRSH